MPYILKHLIPQNNNRPTKPRGNWLDRRLAIRGGQKTLSEQSGIAQPVLCRYFDGTRQPCVRHAITLAKALGVTVEQLVDALPGRPSQDKAPTGGRGRRKRGITMFPGSSTFAAEAGISRPHLYRVLCGERVSASLVERFADWLEKQGMEWPAAAVVKPKRLQP